MNRRQVLARAADALAAWNRGDPDGVVVDVADDVILRDVVLGVLHGRDALRDATDEALRRGVTGVPTVAVGDELFWGDDRLEDAARALDG